MKKLIEIIKEIIKSFFKKVETSNKRYRFDSKEHLHTLNGKFLTGTSSIGDVLAKNLVWWAAELAAVECLESGEKIPTIREEYLEAAGNIDKKQAIDALQKKYPIFKKARFAHFDNKNEKAKKGTDLHAELEHWVKSQMGKVPERADYDTRIYPFIEWAKKNVNKFIASEANCYSEKLWIGGIIDLVAELNNGKLAIIDFKSAKNVYPTHFIQAAGYSIQVDENGLFNENGSANKKLDKNIETLIVVPFGAEIIKPEIRENIKDWQNGFKQAVGLYRLLGLEVKK